jgi:hypothetical protein
MNGVQKDLTGMAFGKLTVLRIGEKRGVNYHWICQCACGSEASIRGSALRHGEALSCGCLRKERAIKANTTHGKSKDGAYSSWQSMMHRCYDKSHDQYHRYGGNGVIVCDLNAAINLKNKAVSPTVTACGEDGSGRGGNTATKPASVKQEDLSTSC